MVIKVALIGSGIFAKDEHLPAIQASPDLQLVAVYSRSLESAQTLATELSDIDLYSEDSGEGKTYNDLLANKDVQAFIIALPIANQGQYIKQALEAGKHVLSEKPIAKDVAQARELMSQYGHQRHGGTWSIAENYRHIHSFVYAAAKVQELGRVLSFRAKNCSFVEEGGRYFETPWRKTPTHQGGFILDGGIHYVAALRSMLGPNSQPTKVSAFTAQLQQHLPPVDTLDSIWMTQSQASGALAISFASSERWSEYHVQCEKGSVTVGEWPRTVTVRMGGKEVEKKVFKDEGSGVKDEVQAWANAIKEGREDSRLTPREALIDLEVTEAMLRSGEQGGTPVELVLAELNE